MRLSVLIYNELACRLWRILSAAEEHGGLFSVRRARPSLLLQSLKHGLLDGLGIRLF